MPIFVKDKPPVQGSGAPPRPALPRSRSALLWQALAALSGGLLAAGQVYGGAAPFGLALVMGCAPGYLLPAAVGAALGSLLFLPTDLALKLMGAILAAAMARLAARQIRRSETRLAVGAGCGALLLEQGIVGLGSGLAVSPGSNAAVLGTAVLAGGLGLAVQAFPAEKPRGACLWLAMLTACAQRLAVGGFAPGLTLAAAGGLCAAYAGSLEQSAVLSVALAAALTAATPDLAYGALAAALGTLGASTLCAGRRWSCAGVFALGCGLGALAAPGWMQAVGILAGASSGILLYILTPPALLRAFFPPPAPPAASQSLSGAARRLSTVADTLSDIADTVNAVCARQLPPRGETYDFVVDYAAQHVCQQCSRREQCWIQGFSTAMDGLYQLRGVLEANGRVEVENLPAQLTVCTHPSDLCAAVTHGYRLWCSRRQTRARANMLRTALTEQYSAMATALAQLSNRLGQAGLPDPRAQAKVSQLFAAIGLEALECSVTTDVAGRTTANITVPRTNLTQEECRALSSEMSRICRRDFDLPDVASCRTVTMLSFGERPLYRVQFGAASRPAPGETVCGDAHEEFCDHAGRAQMLLCDGMGTGRAAAVDGRLAAKLTGQLLRAGFAAESAARLVNVAMGLKNGDQESGATLDLLTVDLFTGRAGLFKAGAAPSFLVRDGVPRMLEGASLPMGILGSVVGRSNALNLCAGDMVVLVSDGALCDGSEWLMQQLQLCARLGHTPQQAADAVADSAVRRATGHRDDITVTVLTLEAGGK